MLYIVTALKPEAQAFVDKYKLLKEKLSGFTIFKNHEITLIVSGLGVRNAILATQTLIDHYDITDDDIYLNVGICAASAKYEIGELLEINRIAYDSRTYTINNRDGKSITCLDEESNSPKYDIADMESFGFYDAVRHSPAIKTFYVLKIVSDHFEPSKVTKEGTKSLVFNKIDDINNILLKKGAE